ncbi:MAG: hypothetical protein FWE20_02840 [Defluviitaleaceae bacterium]|nr:hypothetical protein [Defluviitaleaceae bacterium]
MIILRGGGLKTASLVYVVLGGFRILSGMAMMVILSFFAMFGDIPLDDYAVAFGLAVVTGAWSIFVGVKGLRANSPEKERRIPRLFAARLAVDAATLVIVFAVTGLLPADLVFMAIFFGMFGIFEIVALFVTVKYYRGLRRSEGFVYHDGGDEIIIEGEAQPAVRSPGSWWLIASGLLYIVFSIPGVVPLIAAAAGGAAAVSPGDIVSGIASGWNILVGAMGIKGFDAPDRANVLIGLASVGICLQIAATLAMGHGIGMLALLGVMQFVIPSLYFVGAFKNRAAYRSSGM